MYDAVTHGKVAATATQLLVPFNLAGLNSRGKQSHSCERQKSQRAMLQRALGGRNASGEPRKVREVTDVSRYLPLHSAF